MGGEIQVFPSTEDPAYRIRTLDEILEEALSHHDGDLDIDFLMDFYYFALEAQQGLVRVSGHPTSSHTTNVAYHLARLREQYGERIGTEMLAAAMGHDLFEDTLVSPGKVRMMSQEYGRRTSLLMEAMTRLCRTVKQDKELHIPRTSIPGLDPREQYHVLVPIYEGLEPDFPIMRFVDSHHNVQTSHHLPDRGVIYLVEKVPEYIHLLEESNYPELGHMLRMASDAKIIDASPRASGLI